MIQTFMIRIEGNEADGYTATAPQLPGCIAEGDTIPECLADFAIGLAALLEVYERDKMLIPLSMEWGTETSTTEPEGGKG